MVFRYLASGNDFCRVGVLLDIEIMYGRSGPDCYLDVDRVLSPLSQIEFARFAVDLYRRYQDNWDL